MSCNNRCFLKDCLNSEKSIIFEDISLFVFPSDEKRLKQWFVSLNLDPNEIKSKNQRICNRHFNPTDIKKNMFRTCLKRKAITFLNPTETISEFKCCGNNPYGG